MENQNLKLHSNLRRTIMVVSGIVISVFFIAMSIWYMEWGHVFEALSNAQMYPWLFFAVLSYLTGHLVRGARTRLLVSRDAKLSLFTASNIVVVGYAVNNIFPARIGELARAGMLCERTGISFVQSAAVVFLERVLDGIVILLLLVVSALFINAGGSIEETIYFASVILGLAAICVMFAVIAPNRLMGVISKVIYAISPRLHDAAMRFTTSIINGFNYMRRPADALKIFVLSIVIWLFDVGLFLFLLPAFGLELNVWQAIFVIMFANIGILFPPYSPGYSSPGYIGPFHALCIQGLVFFGIAQATAVGFAVVMHLAIYLPLIIWGGAVILWYGITLGLTINLAKRAKTIAELPEQVPVPANLLGSTSLDKESKSTSVFIFQLTEAALPLDSFSLSEPRSVVSYVADFIQKEIRNLPKKFQLLFSIGMFCFNMLVWLRYFRSFSLLSLPLRVKIFNRWAYGKLALPRQLFRLVRSTALLAFFEHPAVIDVLENKKV
jgi:hypothetical protein